MSFNGNGDVAVSDGARSRGTFTDAPDPFCLSHEFALPIDGLFCPFTNDMVCSVEGLLAGTGRRETKVGGSCRRAEEEVCDFIMS